MKSLREIFEQDIKTQLMAEFGIRNSIQFPKLTKISVNAGIGKLYKDNKDIADAFFQEFASFTGQKPTYKKSKISEAGFNVRKNDTIGISVTLRGQNMWNFLEKLVRVSLPRIRDFKGVSGTSFDENGNFSLGIKEHVIFPEVDANKTKAMRPLQVTLVFENSNPDFSKRVLSSLGVPFSK